MTVRIQSLGQLRKEMIAVARGSSHAPKHAGQTIVESAAALTRLLTPENRALLAEIRDHKPKSIAALARTLDRAASNVTRTLQKLEAVGLVSLEDAAGTKAPRVRVRRILVEIDPYSTRDTVLVEEAAVPA